MIKKSYSSNLIDPVGRRIRKLRVSLLDACNFRCFYCMPEDTKFMNSSRLLSPSEISNIVSTLLGYGIDQVRLTGGEPLLRKEFRDIVLRLSELNLKKLSVTTNGYYLSQHLEFLKNTKCKNINISLDSLNKDKFNLIARRDGFENVYSATVAAAKMEFAVKVNVVMLKGVNDQEVFDFIQFAADHNIEVRFLEIMKIGQACGKQDSMFISAQEVINRISSKYKLIRQSVESDSTSFNFVTESGARIGFIASESQPFCQSCSRWRLSADGFLRACLMSEKGYSLRGVPREEQEVLFRSLLKLKPTSRIKSVDNLMNQIGG